jgi:ACS family glucarate transporter-like MFS transporter/ACS family D-galactonate transporter-like MFS transporter
VRALVLTLCCALSFLLYLHRYSWGFIKRDVQQEFGWQPVELGWLDSCFVSSYGLGQVPAGMLCDWFGAHALLGSAILLWSLALAGVALATGFASMAVARVTFGAAQAAGYPALSKVSKNWFPVASRTSAQALFATFFGRAGGAASFILFGTVLLGWLHLPWRIAVGVFTLLGLAAGVAFLLLYRNTPRQHPWANAAEADLVAADDPTAACATHSRLDWRVLLRSRTVWFLFLRAVAANMADVLFVYWFPLYLLGERGRDPFHAGWMAALPLLGGALGGVTSGPLQSYWIGRTGRRRWVRSGVALTGKLVAAALMLAALAPVSAAAVACILLVAKFFTDWEQPAEWGTVSDIAGPNAASVFAWVNTFGALGGFVAGPLNGLMLGSLAVGGRPTTAGWHALFVLVALEYVVAAGSWLWIDCSRPLEATPAGKCA